MFFISLSVKQNLGHAWFLGQYTLGKLMFFIALSVKQNLGYTWFLGSLTLGKLMLFICLSDKHNFSYAWFLGFYTLGTSTSIIWLSLKYISFLLSIFFAFLLGYLWIYWNCFVSIDNLWELTVYSYKFTRNHD